MNRPAINCYRPFTSLLRERDLEEDKEKRSSSRILSLSSQISD